LAFPRRTLLDAAAGGVSQGLTLQQTDSLHFSYTFVPAPLNPDRLEKRSIAVAADLPVGRVGCGTDPRSGQPRRQQARNCEEGNFSGWGKFSGRFKRL
jgi:hypothetical protein